MIYIILVIGIILFIYGYRKSGLIAKEFEVLYNQASNDSELKLINHTISEEALKQDIELLKKEVAILKKYMTGRSPVETANQAEEKQIERTHVAAKEQKKETTAYDALYQRLQESEEDSLEALSKEMKIGKGELLLLKKLSGK